MDDEDESKRPQPVKRLGSGGLEQQVAAKKLKKDFAQSTSSPSPSPSPTGERVHALTKQTPVRNDFLKSTSSPSPSPIGEEIHALTKQTPVRNDFTKSTSSPSPYGEEIHALTKQTLQANSQQIFQANSQQKGKGKANGQQTLQANSSQQKGKNIVSTEEVTRGPIFADVSTETSQRPFLKGWYNLELKKQDRETWDKFDGCYRAIQTSNIKKANYWLSQLEISQLSLQKKEISHLSLERKLGEVQQLVARLVSFSSTSKSDLLKTKEKDLFSETSSEEQRNLKSIFSQLQTADLVNLSIEDFLDLLKSLEVQGDGVRELESKVEVQKMTNLYLQQLIDDNRLLAFFQQLEDPKIT